MTDQDTAVEFATRVARNAGHPDELIAVLPEVIESAVANGATLESGEGTLSLRWPVAGAVRPLMLLYVDQSACLELNFARQNDPTLGAELERRLGLALPQTGGTLGSRPNFSLRALELPDSRLALSEVFHWISTRTQPVESRHVEQLLTDGRLTAWLDGTVELDDTAERFDLPDQRAKGLPRFDALTSLEEWPQIRRALRRYVLHCVPLPRGFEWSHWVVSAVPRTGQTAQWRRLCAVSINQMETLVIGRFTDETGTRLRSCVNVSQSVLLSRDESGQAFLARMSEAVDLSERDYRASQGDSISVIADGFEPLMDVLEDEQTVKAARRLNLQLLRRGETSYHSSHCFPLADVALGPSEEEKQPG